MTDDPNTMTLKHLRAALKERGLSHTGPKHELVAAILAALAREQPQIHPAAAGDPHGLHADADAAGRLVHADVYSTMHAIHHHASGGVLYVSGQEAARDRAQLAAHNCTTIVNCTADMPLFLAHDPSLQHYRFDLLSWVAPFHRVWVCVIISACFIAQSRGAPYNIRLLIRNMLPHGPFRMLCLLSGRNTERRKNGRRHDRVCHAALCGD